MMNSYEPMTFLAKYVLLVRLLVRLQGHEVEYLWEIGSTIYSEYIFNLKQNFCGNSILSS